MATTLHLILSSTDNGAILSKNLFPLNCFRPRETRSLSGSIDNIIDSISSPFLNFLLF